MPGLIGTPISESYFLRYFYRKLWNHCFVSLRPLASGICLLSLVSAAYGPKLPLILLLNFLELPVMSSCFARMLSDLASNISIQFVKDLIPWQRRRKKAWHVIFICFISKTIPQYPGAFVLTWTLKTSCHFNYWSIAGSWDSILLNNVESDCSDEQNHRNPKNWPLLLTEHWNMYISWEECCMHLNQLFLQCIVLYCAEHATDNFQQPYVGRYSVCWVFDKIKYGKQQYLTLSTLYADSLGSCSSSHNRLFMYFIATQLSLY